MEHCTYCHNSNRNHDTSYCLYIQRQSMLKELAGLGVDTRGAFLNQVFYLMHDGILSRGWVFRFCRLSVENGLKWRLWIHDLVRSVEEGDFGTVANVLSQHVFIDREEELWTLQDDGYLRQMFTRPEILRNAQRLWEEISPRMCPEYRGITKLKLVRTWGWQLS